jgi:hypothetical protein
MPTPAADRLLSNRDRVLSHGGSIAVDSLPEIGTTFTIDLPLDGRLGANTRTLGNPTRS